MKAWLALLISFLILPVVSGAQLSASFGSYDTTITKGSQFTVPITVTMPSGSNGTVDVTIIPKTGLSCSECSEQLKFTTSGSKDVSFSIYTDIAGTYGEPFTVKATSTAATSTTATATSSVVVSEVNNLGVIFYNTSVPVKVGDIWQIPMRLEITTRDIAYTGVNVTLDLSKFTSNIAGIAVGPQSYYVGDMPARTTRTFDWVVNVTGFSVYGISGYILSDQGTLPDDKGFTSTGDYEPPSFSVTTSVGGGGGGGGGAAAPKITLQTSKGKVEIKIDYLPANKDTIVTIPSTENMPVTNLKINVNKKVSKVEMNITTLDAKPSDISGNIGGVIKDYIQIDTKNIQDADINNVTNGFKVPLSWINDNNLDKATVILNRHTDGGWTALTTTKTNEDSSNVYYSALSPGLSVFGISGQVQTTVTTMTTLPVTTTMAPATTTAPPIAPTTTATPTEEEQSKSSTGKIILALVVIAIIAGTAYYFYQQKCEERCEPETEVEIQEEVSDEPAVETEEESPAEEAEGAEAPTEEEPAEEGPAEEEPKEPEAEEGPRKQ